MIKDRLLIMKTCTHPKKFGPSKDLENVGTRVACGGIVVRTGTITQIVCCIFIWSTLCPVRMEDPFNITEYIKQLRIFTFSGMPGNITWWWQGLGSYYERVYEVELIQRETVCIFSRAIFFIKLLPIFGYLSISQIRKKCKNCQSMVQKCMVTKFQYYYWIIYVLLP